MDSRSSSSAWCASTGVVAVYDAASASISLSFPSTSSSNVVFPTLPLPFPNDTRCDHLSFSPDGMLLVAFTAPPYSLTTGASSHGLHMSVYRCVDDGTLNGPWSLVHQWDSNTARYAGPSIDRIVDLHWYGEQRDMASSGGKRKPDQLANSGATGDSFLAILDTQECLLFHLPATSPMPFMTITSLSRSFTSRENLSQSSAGLSDNDANISANRAFQPRRIILHASISSSLPIRDGSPHQKAQTYFSSRSVVAYKSRKIPQSIRTVTDVTTSLILPPPASVITDNIALPEAQASGPADNAQQPTALPLPLTTQAAAPGSIATKMFEDPYGEVNISALDELFDFDDMMGSGSRGFMDETADFGSAFGGYDRTSNADSKGLVEEVVKKGDSDPQVSASPAKSGGSATSSPRKSTNATLTGVGRDQMGSETDDRMPEILPGHDAWLDEEQEAVQLWEIVVDWENLSLTSRQIDYLPLFDPLNPDVATAASYDVSHICFFSSISPAGTDSFYAAELTLLAVSGGSHLHTWSITRGRVALSSAFDSLEGRKKESSTALSELSEPLMEWIVKKRASRALHQRVHHHDTKDITMEEPRENAGAVAVHQVVHCSDRMLLLATAPVGRDDTSVDGPDRISLQYLDSDSLELDQQHAPRALPAVSYPYALTLQASPTGSLVLAHPVIQSIYQNEPNAFEPRPPAIFSAPAFADERTYADMLGERLANALWKRQSWDDLKLVMKAKPLPFRLKVVQAAWYHAGTHLLPADQGQDQKKPSNVRVEQSRLLIPLITAQHILLADSAAHASISSHLTGLMACQRILQNSKTTVRGNVQLMTPGPTAGQTQQSQPIEVFESSAVWPIIGHIAWLFQLWDDIVKAMLGDAFEDNWSECAFLLLHPLPRLIQQRVIRLIARFANYVMGVREGVSSQHSYGGSSSDTTGHTHEVDIVRSVLGDLIFSNRVKTQEWSVMLHALNAKLGAEWANVIPVEEKGGNAARVRTALETLQLPDELRDVARDTRNGMKEKLAQNTPRTPAGDGKRKRSKSGYDIVTRAMLTDETIAISQGLKNKRVCIGCHGVNIQNTTIAAYTQSGWEASKTRSCICGSPWVAA